MRIPRLAALWAVVAIVLAACTGGGASPSASAGGSARLPLPARSACRGTTSSSHAGLPLTSRTSRDAIEAGGGTYTEAVANLTTTQQLTDVENLINQDINVLILLAKDPTTIGPALETAANAGVPVIAYDRLIEDPSVLYITFDNVGVGAAEARPCSRRCRPARTS